MKSLVPVIALLFFFADSFAGKVDTIAVHSVAMQKEIKCVVIRPDHYKKAGALPVIYLLHGYGGNYRAWLNDAPQLIKKADELKVLLVLPDGGFNSWYFDSPVDPSVRYETFIIKELIPYVDQHFNTIPQRGFRAITGLSMGGHGALYLSIRHLDMFSMAGSMAGGVDVRPFPRNWDLIKKLGDTIEHKTNWDDNMVITVADRLKNGDLKLIIDCGLGDFFLNVNRSLHQKLMEKNIDHDYIERPGKHDGQYWGNSVDFQLFFFRRAFDENKHQY